MNSGGNNTQMLVCCVSSQSSCPILLVPGWLNSSLQSMGSTPKHLPTIFLVEKVNYLSSVPTCK